MVTKVGYRVLEQYMRVVHELMKKIQIGLSQNEIDTFHKVVHHLKCSAESL
jgi:hypothetical protein